jgi:hypothetical protein
MLVTSLAVYVDGESKTSPKVRNSPRAKGRGEEQLASGGDLRRAGT